MMLLMMVVMKIKLKIEQQKKNETKINGKHTNKAISLNIYLISL